MYNDDKADGEWGESEESRENRSKLIKALVHGISSVGSQKSDFQHLYQENQGPGNQW